MPAGIELHPEAIVEARAAREWYTGRMNTSVALVGAQMNEVEMNHSEIQIYPPDKQASGEFDGGRITEIKPIGFSGDGSAVDRVGPLFYWAWASSMESAKIGLHPHRGFEIISYVLSGEVGHGDTLGNATRVASGGAQVMQTGSGVSHEEQTGDDTESDSSVRLRAHDTAACRVVASEVPSQVDYTLNEK